MHPETTHLGDERDVRADFPVVGDARAEVGAEAVGVLLAEREVEAFGSGFREPTDADVWPQTIYPTGKTPARFWP